AAALQAGRAPRKIPVSALRPDVLGQTGRCMFVPRNMDLIMTKTSLPAAAMPALADRAERVSPFIVMDVMSQAAAIERDGGSVIHMEVGQPSAPTPASIRAAASQAL